MKKLIFIAIAIAAFSPAVFAGHSVIDSHRDPKSTAKLPALVISNNANDAEPGGVSGKAFKHFNKNYAYASHVKWIDIDDGFEAIFKEDDKLTRVFYKKSGNWQYTLMTYLENKMPEDLRTNIKSEYFDYRITGVTEINVPEKTVYMVNLEDDRTILTIRVSDGEKQVYSRLYKAD